MNETALRTCKVHTSSGWKDIEFEHLKEGDLFRLYEPGGKPVKDNEGHVSLRAKTAPYDLGDGNYGIDAVGIGEPVEEFTKKTPDEISKADLVEPSPGTPGTSI